MKRTYKKKSRSELALQFAVVYFYKVIFSIILFLIFIGESVRFLISILLKLAFLLFKYGSKESKILFRSFSVSLDIPIRDHFAKLAYAYLSFQTRWRMLLKIKVSKMIALLTYYTLGNLKVAHSLSSFLGRTLLGLVQYTKSIFHNVESVLRILLSLLTKTGGIGGRIKFEIPRKKLNDQTMHQPIRKRKHPFRLYLPVFPKIYLRRPKIYVPPLRSKVAYFFFGLLVSLIMFMSYQGYLFIQSLPNPKMIGYLNYPLSTHLYDRNGKLLYEIYHDQNRTPIRLEELPEYVSQAAIAIEDKDFYSHNGISFFSGIVRAFKENILKGTLQGGSTITQQLVKTALLTPEKTIQRKIKEMILAVWTEQLFTKKQILQMYFNQVAYGGSSYGIEEAAKTYFGLPAKDLTLDQASFLAGLPQAPSYYSPYSNPEEARERRNEVLRKMQLQGYITSEQMADAQAKPLGVIPLTTSIKSPHFVFYVKRNLEEKYGIKQVEEGGLRVVTTLDLRIQQEAEKILKEELAKVRHLNVTNGGILVTKPSTGEILAMVGSSDYFASPSGAFNVTTALRQPGSSIKPILYSLALERGYTAATIIDDTPITFRVSASEIYQPVNYDGKFHGKIPFRFALANSYNIPAVRVLSTIGVDSFVQHARLLGILTWTDSSRYGLSLTLGGGEVTMVDMATAFGVFANRGYRVNTTPIHDIENTRGEKLYTQDDDKVKVVDEANAFIISDILSDNFSRVWAFGSRSALEIPGYKVAVKTGTTDNKKDNWTIGYTPDFVVVVWVGNNDGSFMHPYLSSGVTGAAPVWNRTMNYLLKNYSKANNWYSKPESVIEQTCYFGRKEYFIKGTESNSFCNRKILESSNPSTKPNTFN